LNNQVNNTGIVDSDITTIILTFNEEQHIARSIKSAAQISKKIYIVDSFSTDKTLDIAKSFNVDIVQNKFINYSKQYEWALNNLKLESSWIMRLDADEFLEDDLINEIKIKLPSISKNIVGINFKRKHIFMDKWIRFGGRYPLILLRLWRNGFGTIEDRWMDEHIIVRDGKTTTFKNNFVDHNLNDLAFFKKKHTNYAVREAIDVLIDKLNLINISKKLNKKSSSLNAFIKRFIKEKIYNKLPFGSGPLFYFIYRYFVLLGFLDGKAGFQYHYLQGYWYRTLVSKKVLELEKKISHLKNKEEVLLELSRLTNYKI
jgi:glycosyltransferase involved in cell wall biosynthesis